MTTELMKLGSRGILGKTVTAFGTVENPLFPAGEVADWIEHSNVSTMLQSVDDDEKVLSEGLTSDSNDCLESGNLRTKRWYLTENGLYEVLMLSRKPVAKEFKKGVKQLLHDLRTGKAKMQLSGNELVLAAMTHLQTELGKEQQLRLTAEAQIASDAPKVLFSKAVATSHTEILVGELAKILHQNGVDIGQNRLFEWLRNEGYLCKSGTAYNMPTQRSMDLGLFRIKETVITHSDGHISVNKTPKVYHSRLKIHYFSLA
jgi:anti-repressor protein